MWTILDQQCGQFKEKKLMLIDSLLILIVFNMTLEIFDNFGIIFYNFCLTQNPCLYVPQVNPK